MDNQLLDKYLEALKVKKYAEKHDLINTISGRTSAAFNEGHLVIECLVSDGYAKYPNSNLNIIHIHPDGMRFKGYVQQENERLLAEEERLSAEKENKEVEFLRKQNFELSNEKMAYEREGREKDRIIIELTEDKLKYEQEQRSFEEHVKYSTLLKNWWGLLVAAVCLGIAIGKLIF